MTATTTPLVKSLQAIANAKQATTLLNEGNFEVLEVRPMKVPTGGKNTIVRVKIDKYPDTTLPIADADRYIEKTQTISRIDLKDAALSYEAVMSNGKVLVSDITTAEAVQTGLEGIGINIAIDEFTLIPSDTENALVVAKADSLGYTGQISITTVDTGEGSEFPPPAWVNQINATFNETNNTFAYDTKSSVTLMEGYTRPGWYADRPIGNGGVFEVDVTLPLTADGSPDWGVFVYVRPGSGLPLTQGAGFNITDASGLGKALMDGTAGNIEGATSPLRLSITVNDTTLHYRATSLDGATVYFDQTETRAGAFTGALYAMIASTAETDPTKVKDGSSLVMTVASSV